MEARPRSSGHTKVEPWVCPKCGITVFVIPVLHAYVCSLYRQQAGRSR